MQYTSCRTIAQQPDPSTYVQMTKTADPAWTPAVQHSNGDATYDAAAMLDTAAQEDLREQLAAAQARLVAAAEEAADLRNRLTALTAAEAARDAAQAQVRQYLVLTLWPCQYTSSCACP